MSASKALRTAVAVIGKATASQVVDANGGLGNQWLATFGIASQGVKEDYPQVDGMEISGAKAHQSHTVSSHSNILSVKFYAGENRIVSGHLHLNGHIDYSKTASGASAGSNSTAGWEPTRDEVDQTAWTIFDPEKKKNREVKCEGKWWYIEKGAEKVWF